MMADDPESSSFGEGPWDGDSQPSEGTGVNATDGGIPSASESVDTTESSSMNKPVDTGAASVNVNGPGREHHGKVLRVDKLAEEIERLSKEKLNDVMKDKGMYQFHQMDNKQTKNKKKLGFF